MKVKEQIQQFMDIRDLADASINRLQEECQHMTFWISMHPTDRGGVTPQRICSDCKSLVPGVTEAEFNEAWAKFSKMMREIG